MTRSAASAAAALALGIAGSGLIAVAPAFAADSAKAPVSVTMIVALTAPQRSTGLIDATLLENYTSEFGLLTTKLDQVINRPVAIGIDPSIIASIRILGGDAPESAVLWLDRLAGASNETFPLSWADGDLTLPLHAGSNELLEPESFDFAIDPGRFAPTPDQPAESETASPTPTPTATTPPDDGTLPPLPTSESLVAWDYSVPAIAWPTLNSVTGDDLTTIDAAYDQVLLASTNVGSGQAKHGLATVNDAPALIYDAALSTEFGLTVTAGSGAEWTKAMAKLAHSVGDVPSTVADPASVIIAIDRDVAVNDVDMGLTISTLVASANVRSQPLTEVLAGSPTNAKLSDIAVDEATVTTVTALLLAESLDREFSLIADNPALISSQRRLDLLATLSNAWHSSTSGWALAAETYTTASTTLRDSVKIVKSSSITLWADRASLPVTVSNELDQPVTVYVSVTPRTPLLKIENSHVKVTIEPHAQRKAAVPVQSLSNGTVQLDVRIVGPLSTRIGAETHVSISVQAGWETPVTVAAGVVVVLIFVLGVIRTVLRRRRARAVEA